MIEIRTSIEIDAPASKVWQILTDFERMPDWNPLIPAISGTATEGETIAVTIQPPGKKGMDFKPRILIAEPERELRWLGTLVGSWLFAGEHFYICEATENGKTIFHHGEDFSGLLAPLMMGGEALKTTEAGFIAMNEALKEQAEQG